MPLVWSVQNIGLFAEECISLIDDILDYFGTSTPVFNAKGWRIIGIILVYTTLTSYSRDQRLLLLLAANAVLVVELADQAIWLTPVGGSVRVLVIFLDAQNAWLDAIVNALKAALLSRAIVRIIINRCQKFQFVCLRWGTRWEDHFILLLMIVVMVM